MNDRDDGDPFVLVVANYVPFVNPVDYGLGPDTTVSIDPADYFITSGDAVSKATTLEREMWAAAGAARRRHGSSKVAAHRQYVGALWSAAGRCRVLVNRLKRVRGDALWLETEWIDHKLVCRPKNPRSRMNGDDAGR